MSAPCLDSERSRPTQWTQPDGSPAGLVAFAFGARYQGRLHAVDGADAVGTELSVCGVHVLQKLTKPRGRNSVAMFAS